MQNNYRVLILLLIFKALEQALTKSITVRFNQKGNLPASSSCHTGETAVGVLHDCPCHRSVSHQTEIINIPLILHWLQTKTQHYT